MEINQIYIEQVIASRTWKIRQEVLYPKGSLKDVMIDDDFDGTHFAASVEGEIVGVISVFEVDKETYQFRKFAVLSTFRGYGIGAALLNSVFDFCALWNGRTLYCDARADAVSFYKKFGMQEKGQPFVKGTLAYVRMQICLVDDLA